MKLRSLYSSYSHTIVLISIVFIVIFLSGCSPKKVPIRYAISPYQDTALPIVGAKNNWYSQEGLNVEIKLLDWQNVMDSVASGAIDVGVMNFNTFQPVYHNINDRGGNVVMYYPLYVFKGGAIMVRKESGMKTMNDLMADGKMNRDQALKQAISQLKGKRIITTKGSDMEQIVLSALEKAGLKPGIDVKISDASSSDGLRAFLAGEGDGYSGGLTERTEARRHGGVELVTSADLLPPVIDGLVTTKTFASTHKDEMNKLIAVWFRTITWMDEDLDNRSKVVIDYLSSQGATRYTVEEYKYAWQHAQVFPKSPSEMQDTILAASAPYYWKRSWDANNQFLLKQSKISSPVPYEAFEGEAVQKTLGNVVKQ